MGGKVERNQQRKVNEPRSDDIRKRQLCLPQGERQGLAGQTWGQRSPQGRACPQTEKHKSCQTTAQRRMPRAAKGLTCLPPSGPVWASRPQRTAGRRRTGGRGKRGRGCRPGGVDQEEQAGHTGVTPRSPSQLNFLYPSPHFSGPLFPHLHSANHARAPRTAGAGRMNE